MTLSTVAQVRENTIAAQSKRRNIVRDSEIAPTFQIKGRNIEILPVIGIFGANASGKSNILDALNTLIGFMAWGIAPKRGESFLTFVPFRLDKKCREAPTRFEIRVARHEAIFTYNLVVDSSRILHEKLEYIPPHPKQMRNRLLFDRVWKEAEVYSWRNGKDFGKSFREIQNSIKGQEPFMSFLARRIKSKIVAPLTEWLTNWWPGVTPTGEGEYLDIDLAKFFAGKSHPPIQKAITKLIRIFDTNLSDISLEKITTEDTEENYRIWAWHETNGQRVRWPFEEESTGTQRLYVIAARVLDAFNYGTLFLIDELGSNIHPNITRVIVHLFQNARTNPRRAQLIFTSHDNTLQRGSLLRRDQIWFTQKRKDASTDLYPLSDFRPRNDLAIDRAYLDGRFGAVPILPNEEELLDALKKAGEW